MKSVQECPGSTSCERVISQTKLQQARQCTYDLRYKRFCATVVATEKQYILHILSV